MQNGYESDFSKRAQYYTSKAICNQLGVAEKYRDIKKVHCICFLSGRDRSHANLYPELFTNETLYDRIKKEERPTLFEYYYINLEQLCNNNYDFSDFALAFFKLMNIKRKDELYSMETQDEYIKKSIDYIKKINNDPVIKAQIDRETRERLDYDSDMEFSKERGYNEGIEQKQNLMIQAMLKENLDLELISKITGLTIEEIKAISQ